MFGFFRGPRDRPFVCPRCDGVDHKVWALPNFMYIHWILNPGLMVNELVLGQRIPARLYWCNGCPISTHKPQFVYCAECDHFHDAAIWSGAHAFGHWLGCVCPDCGKRIPTLRNVTAFLVLIVLTPLTWPLWWCFGKRFLAWEQWRALKARAALEAQEYWEPEAGNNPEFGASNNQDTDTRFREGSP